ncbi:MAG: chromate transporter [Clostridia bacterium]|nr:chromate transporter [Clostridia bacterium]
MKRHAAEKRPFGQVIKELLSLFAVFFKIGLFSFGGGYAMLTLIEAEVVDKHKWITKSELGDIFAIAESTPGPIAVNTATFIGTKRLGVFGGIFATLGVVLPSFIIIVALSYILNLVKDNKWVGFLFKGIRVGVLVLIAKAVFSFFKDMKKTIFSFALMIISFLLVFLLKVDVIYVILGTILVCSVAVAVRTYIKHRRYHTVGTPEYYNPTVGKPLDKDEYFSQKAVDTHEIIIKTRDCDEIDTKCEETNNNGGEEK